MRPIRLSFLATLGVAATIRAASPLGTTVVLGRSMEPSMRAGSIHVLDRSYYRTHTLSRGDVVVLRMGTETLIKRVHALAGDRVLLLQDRDGLGAELLEPREVIRVHRAHALGKLRHQSIESITVPAGHCFVLGDNAPVSVDSRHFGPVPIRAILGRAL
jgi:signal peptidase I